MKIITPIDVFRKPMRHIGTVTSGNGDPSYHALEALYVSYVLVPILAGAGMVAGLFANWGEYFPSALLAIVPEMTLLNMLGTFEILLGIFVALRPRAGGWAVAVWLWAGIACVLFEGAHAGLAICLAAMSAGAVSLSMLMAAFEESVFL